MRAAVFDGPGKPLRLETLPVPKPAPGEVLIRLKASGVCHTDVHIWKGGIQPRVQPRPFILGHEGVGEVAALGDGVTGWAIGDRAGAGWLHDTCGVCDECRDGAESFCQTHRAHGFDVPGTFAEYVVAKADFAVRLPAAAWPSLAPLMCAGVTAHGAIERAGVRHGECCAIFGCGGLGLYAVQLAARRGAHVVAVDVDAAKLARARVLGASETIDASGSGSGWPASRSADACINFAPTAATWGTMINAVRPRGRIVAAAMVSAAVPLNQEWLTATGVSITGTSVGTRGQMAELMEMHRRAPLAVDITEIRLDDVSEALDRLGRGAAGGRFCVVF